jgi:hypothetical protein
MSSDHSKSTGIHGLELLQQQAAKISESMWQKQIATSVSRLQEAFDQLLPAVRFQAEISRQIAPVLQGWQKWYAQLVPIIQIQSKWAEQIAPVFENIKRLTQLTSPLLERLAEWQKKWYETIQDENDISKAFLASNLLVSPSMPHSLIRKVVQLSKAGEHRRAHQTIVGYYRKKRCFALQQVIRTWNGSPMFRSRMEHIKQALDAHIERRYSLSIPVLVAQIEGIATDIVKSRNISNVKLGKSKAVVKEVVSGKGTPLNHAMYDSLVSFMDKTLYEHTDFRKDYSSIRKSTKLSRHGILHGVQLKYANHGNSLKAFLVLDILSFIANEY